VGTGVGVGVDGPVHDGGGAAPACSIKQRKINITTAQQKKTLTVLYLIQVKVTPYSTTGIQLVIKLFRQMTNNYRFAITHGELPPHIKSITSLIFHN